MGSASHVTADIAIPCTKDRQTDRPGKGKSGHNTTTTNQAKKSPCPESTKIGCLHTAGKLHQPESDRSFYPAYELTDTCTFCQKMKKKIPYKC